MGKLNDQKPKITRLNHRMFTVVPTTIVLSLVIFSFIACQDMFKGMGETVVFQQKLAKEFNTPMVINNCISAN
jgi:hypothetical protein